MLASHGVSQEAAANQDSSSMGLRIFQNLVIELYDRPGLKKVARGARCGRKELLGLTLTTTHQERRTTKVRKNESVDAAAGESAENGSSRASKWNIFLGRRSRTQRLETTNVTSAPTGKAQVAIATKNERTVTRSARGRVGDRSAASKKAAAAVAGAATTTTTTTTTTTGIRGVGVLGGLPRALFGADVAHELCHCFLTIGLFTKCSRNPKCVEGLCELFGYLYLKSLLTPSAEENKVPTFLADGERRDEHSHAMTIVTCGRTGGGTSGGIDRRRRATEADAVKFIARMRENRDPVYGAGFREALAAYENQQRSVSRREIETDNKKTSDSSRLSLLLAYVRHKGALPRGRWKPLMMPP